MIAVCCGQMPILASFPPSKTSKGARECRDPGSQANGDSAANPGERDVQAESSPNAGCKLARSRTGSSKGRTKHRTSDSFERPRRGIAQDCSAGRLLIGADSAATRGRPPVGSCHGRRGAFAVVHWSAE
jgi:hypothetical protein